MQQPPFQSKSASIRDKLQTVLSVLMKMEKETGSAENEKRQKVFLKQSRREEAVSKKC